MPENRNTTRGLVRPLALALFCSAALAGAAGTATATPVERTLGYTCATSLGPEVPVDARVTIGLPDEVFDRPGTVGYADPAFLDADVELSLGAVVPGRPAGAVVRIDGDSTATLGATLTGPSGTWTSSAALTFAPAPVGGPRDVLRAAGGFPAMSFHRSGDHVVHLDDLALSLRVERADGTALGAITATCAHDPGQDDVVGVLRSESVIIERPVRPSRLAVTATTPTSATLTWYATPWWFQTWGYDVFLDDAPVAFVTGRQATLTGLAPDSLHRVKVVTRDVRGFRSAKSQGLVFTTPPARG
ncbi:fibronectin type III domain-containing protein [Saccharothrix yanglingensis]|uniref:fibronectin type III domain-containing protein n=1 Tax=Saccharothrix yanglingensis TaxID=659496 RepID=UPI0027D21DE1|nr:fibronectin type III domain-containing protein [Saccharothrix yanglingensis]